MLLLHLLPVLSHFRFRREKAAIKRSCKSHLLPANRPAALCPGSEQAKCLLATGAKEPKEVLANALVGVEAPSGIELLETLCF